MNDVSLIGRPARDPELITTDSGTDGALSARRPAARLPAGTASTIRVTRRPPGNPTPRPLRPPRPGSTRFRWATGPTRRGASPRA